MGKYSYQEIDGKYMFFDGKQPLKTPGGNDVTTTYKPLAERILSDLEKRGMEFRSIDSILAWHFTTIDNFAPMGHDRVFRELAKSFLMTTDWTCKERHGSEWLCTFGKWNDRGIRIADWLQKATVMQMTAACCIGNAYESINIAFALAVIMEKYSGADRENAMKDLANLIAENAYCGTEEEIIRDFGTFELYYGIHLESEGPILTDIIANEPDYEDEEELDVDNLGEREVTIEQLVGRNYYHYTNAELDSEQPLALAILDLDIDESDDEEDEESDESEDDEDGDDEDLSEYLPEDCWVKRFVDDDDPHTFYLLYLVVNKDGKIEDSGCVEETRTPMGGGSFFLQIPGMELTGSKSYDYNSCPPDKVLDDLRLLFKGRFLAKDFTFVGKKLPQRFMDNEDNYNSETEYSFAMQSPQRLAYMHLSIEVDDDGVVDSFEYSTYQSTGSGEWDMFSRPQYYDDRRDEAIEMLLHLYDLYTDEEIAGF